MTIERWPAGERPRERLYWNGADALADAELLALQLGSGRRGKTAVEVAREMLAAYGLLRDVVVSEGTLSASLVHPREVFKPAILESAASIILLHNHPSGDPTPSREDLRLTRQLVEAARLMDLRIHDHVVIGRGRWVSVAQRGTL